MTALLNTPVSGSSSPGASPELAPELVRETLARSILADGFDFVLDLEESRGSHLVDARTGERFLDMFTFFASSALGMNHSALADGP